MTERYHERCILQIPYGHILLKSKSETDHVDGYVIWPYCMNMLIYYIYSRKVWWGGFGKFGKLSMSRQTKQSKLVFTINNLLADLLIHQTFFCQMLKESICQTVPPPNFPASYVVYIW